MPVLSSFPFIDSRFPAQGMVLLIVVGVLTSVSPTRVVPPDMPKGPSHS